MSSNITLERAGPWVSYADDWVCTIAPQEFTRASFAHESSPPRRSRAVRSRPLLRRGLEEMRGRQQGSVTQGG
jgi:hypothetical protein